MCNLITEKLTRRPTHALRINSHLGDGEAVFVPVDLFLGRTPNPISRDGTLHGAAPTPTTPTTDPVRHHHHPHHQHRRRHHHPARPRRRHRPGCQHQSERGVLGVGDLGDLGDLGGVRGRLGGPDGYARGVLRP